MKKNIVLAMTTAAVIAALTGCGSSKTTETTAAATTAAETTTADATTAAESKEADKTDAAAAAEGSLKSLENVDPNGHLGKVLAAGKITMEHPLISLRGNSRMSAVEQPSMSVPMWSLQNTSLRSLA